MFRCGIVGTLASLFLVSTASAQVMSWATQIGNNRFKVLTQFDNAAVLDLETGLVWERQPDTSKTTWFPDSANGNAHVRCNIKAVGKRLGWRLPTVQEIASLFDASHPVPQLPAGHPFILTADQLADSFWTSTVDTTFGEGGQVWIAQMFAPDLQETVVVDDMATPRYYWCVRTGSGTDVQ
jgi:hypothetical protein